MRPMPLTPAERHAVRMIAIELRARIDAGVWEDIALAEIAFTMPATYETFSRLVRRGVFNGIALVDLAQAYGRAAEAA
jgi:hypothetical protein